MVRNTATSVVTIDRFIIEQERDHPHASGALTGILTDLALAAKMIANKVRSAGLADVLGSAGQENVQGEVQQKLDVLANETIIKAMDHGGRLCCMASEEMDDLIPIPDRFNTGPYILLFDPLDGSSNIDVNVPVGTIFSVLRRKSTGKHGTLGDALQPGRDQVAAGYVIYGSSTMLVYTTGTGVHGFTLDPLLGEFLLTLLAFGHFTVVICNRRVQFSRPFLDGRFERLVGLMQCSLHPYETRHVHHREPHNRHFPLIETAFGADQCQRHGFVVS